MERMLNDYLNKIDKHLRPMAASERSDIVREIRSQMLDMEHSGASPAQIVGRLGDPRELARAYLGQSISQARGFSWRGLGAVLAFYSLAGIGGMLVLPVTGICGIAFLISGILCPIAGIVKLGVYLTTGYDIAQIGFTLGSFTASPVAFFPIALVIGVVMLLLGRLCWTLTVSLVKLLGRGRRLLDAE
ncbi:MAG: DUF1700 domain-containing protein [Eubacteriales bacterium]|nr:DUF1700 domain-containing protein [Eubacteriales bacterium]